MAALGAVLGSRDDGEGVLVQTIRTLRRLCTDCGTTALEWLAVYCLDDDDELIP